jgi:hypothetical protein
MFTNFQTSLPVQDRAWSHCRVVGLLGPVALESPVALQLPADGRCITFQQLGNLCLAIFGFLQDVSLVWFLLGKLRIASHM